MDRKELEEKIKTMKAYQGICSELEEIVNNRESDCLNLCDIALAKYIELTSLKIESIDLRESEGTWEETIKYLQERTGITYEESKEIVLKNYKKLRRNNLYQKNFKIIQEMVKDLARMVILFPFSKKDAGICASCFKLRRDTLAQRLRSPKRIERLKDLQYQLAQETEIKEAKESERLQSEGYDLETAEELARNPELQIYQMIMEIQSRYTL